MAHQCIKYRLNADGTIPSFLCLQPKSVGGMYGVADPSEASPRDMVFVGISEANDTGDAEVVASKADLQSYLAQVGANWTEQDPANPNDPRATVPFDASKAATWVWNRLNALNVA